MFFKPAPSIDAKKACIRVQQKSTNFMVVARYRSFAFVGLEYGKVMQKFCVPASEMILIVKIRDTHLKIMIVSLTIASMLDDIS